LSARARKLVDRTAIVGHHVLNEEGFAPLGPPHDEIGAACRWIKGKQ
jgi:hypothetical protein